MEVYNTQEYAIGYKARKGDLKRKDNPFKDKLQRKAWELGWADADYDLT
jgi:hypothetical protein